MTIRNSTLRQAVSLIGMIIFLLSSFPKTVHAQYDSLLNLTYGKDIYIIHNLYRSLINIPDSTQRALKAEEIILFARKHHDQNLELNVDFFLNFWNAFYQHQPKNISLQKLKEQLNQSTKHNVEFLRARSLRALAEFYWKIEKNYQLAFEQYLLLDKELLNANPSEYPEMARDFMQIGQAYYFFRDYPLAIQYFKKAIKLPENSFTTGVINDARNTLGLCYQQLKQYDSAEYCFEQILQSNFKESSAWKRIAKGNIGGNYYLKGQYEQAIPLLEADFISSEQENDWGAASGSAISLADIYNKEHKLQKTKFYIDQSLYYIKKANQSWRLRKLYPIMSKWYADMGDAIQSKKYLDSALITTQLYNEEFNALKVLRAQQEIDRQTEALQLAAYNLEKERKTAERNILIFLLFTLGAVGLIFYFIQRKKQLAKEILFQKASQELELAKVHLNQFTDNIHEKNKLIDELEEKLSQNKAEVDPELLSQLQQFTILTEEDWLQFKLLFDQVHSGFLYRLKDKYPSLTTAEIRFLSLSKLHLNTKEMAAALGVSTQSIRTNWYRIRKKLNLEEAVTVDSLISTI